MIIKEILRKVASFQKEELEQRETGIPREARSNIDLRVPQAIILTGVRRCGKSTLLKQLMKERSHYNYFNFEDQMVAAFEVSDFEKLEEVLPELYGKSNYFFFDEIQNIPKWELFVRKLLNGGKRCIITGSNATLLSKELGTRLTGRHLDYELFPFSYAEFLRFEKKKPSLQSAEKYLWEGGFPEYLQFKKTEFLQEIVKDIITRDIIVRYGLREVKILHELTLYLLTNAGKEFTYNSLTKIFHLGSTTTTSNFLAYLTDSYLLFIVPRFSYSLKKQLVNPKKVYGIDTGLIRTNSATFSEDKGRMLENAVFLHLRRKHKEIYYYKNRGECDFLIKSQGKIQEALQVCLELNVDTKEREMAGLQDALAAFNLRQGTIITWDQEDILHNIKLIPFWKWASKE